MSDREFEVELYGQELTGEESDLDRAKLARICYLKKKMRKRLAALIGDYGDNITDTIRGITMGEAIALGIETDPALIDRYMSYISTLYLMYGGGEAIMGVLEGNMGPLKQNLAEGYYAACSAIVQAPLEEVNRIDLPGEPASTEG